MVGHALWSLSYRSIIDFCNQNNGSFDTQFPLQTSSSINLQSVNSYLEWFLSAVRFALLFKLLFFPSSTHVRNHEFKEQIDANEM